MTPARTPRDPSATVATGAPATKAKRATRAAPSAPEPTPPDPDVVAAATLADTLAPDTTPAPTSPEALAVWLTGRRWFTDPDHADDRAASAPLEVSLTTVALPVEPPLAIGLVDTSRGDRYQLLVPGSTDAHRPDVGDDPSSATVLARWVATGERSEPGPAGAVAGNWPAAHAVIGDAPARPLGDEQSNTSVVVGGTHVLKLFRRLQAGPHPEIEVGRHLALAADAGTTAPVARLVGWYELVPPAGSGDATALGVVQDLVPGALDAWGLVLSGLAGDPGALLARLHQLGTAAAELHGALARPADHPPPGAVTDPEAPASFGAVALTPDRLAVVVAAITADAHRVLATTLGRPAALAPVAGRADEVAALAADLVVRLGTDLGSAIRHHGDLHLGQVVDSHDGWVILDFEGEPTRPLAERRRRHSPLRDVAGMVRSFAYAAATHRRADGHRLADGWEPAARAAFLDGYLSSVDPTLLPTSAAATRTLLTLLELEKVVYEIDYELAHRPGWVGLPVDGLRRLLVSGGA